MAEKVKLLEADIDFEKLLKKGAEAKKSIEFLKTEIKFFQNSIKEGKGLIETYKDSLSKMERQGKKNSKEYQVQEKNLKTLIKSQESNRQKLELVETNLRKQQKQYRLNKKGIDSYNKTVQEELEIIDKTDGSIKQLEHALAQNKNAYRELTAAQRENVEIGGKLFKLISEQDEEYKKLQKSIGTTQVDVGNYKGQIKELLDENVNLSKTFKQQIEQIPIIGSLLGGVYGILLKYAKAQRVAIAATSGSAKALKIFRLALISTGIGAIVVAIGALVAYLASTQSGINKVNKVLIPLKTIFQSLFGVLQQVGQAMSEAFENPQESIKALWESIKTNLVNRVTAIGGIFKALGKVISSGFTDGYEDLANSSLQAVTGVEDVIGKTREFANETSKFFSEAYKRGERIAEIQRILSAGEADYITKLAEGKEAFKEQNKIAEDTTKTLAEREAAAKRSIEILKETNKAQRERNALELELLQLKAASNDTSDEDRAEIARKVAELKASNAELLEAETTQQNKLNTIRREANQKAIAAAKKRIDAAIKESKTQLNIFIDEQGVRAKTLQEELDFAKEISQKKRDILEEELEHGKITRSEFNLAILELDNELLRKQAELAVDNATRELENFKSLHQSKLDAKLFFSEELLKQEVERLDLIAEKEREYHQLRLEQGVINQQEYNDAINAVNEENRIAQEELKAEREEAQREKEAIDFENEMAIAQGNFLQEQNLKLQDLKAKEEAEKKSAEGNGAAIKRIQTKYAKEEKIIEDAKSNYKLSVASQTFANLSTILGKESAVGKAAAIAQTTIDTYQSATAAYKAMAGIPVVGPALGAVAAAAAVAAGIANVKKITSTKETFQEGGYLEGNSHAQGGIPFTIAGQPGFEAEGGEFIVNKVSTARYRPLLEHINKQYGIGKINPSRLYQNGGIVTSNIQQSQATENIKIDYETMAQKIGESVGEANRQLPNPVVAVEDINTGQSNVAEVITGANI